MSISREEKRNRVIEVLNKARAAELQSIHQYMHQHFILDDLDYGELAANVKLIAIDEMKHAEEFAERVTELGGEPTTDLADVVRKGQEVQEIFAYNAELEVGAVNEYNDYLQICRENGDSISAKLFEEIIDDEQEHLNYFEDIYAHIEKLGNTYLARIAGTSSSTGDASKGFV